MKLIIELDGEEHFSSTQIKKDQVRDAFLNNLRLKVIHFENFQILESLDMVLEFILDNINTYLFQRS